MNLIASRNKSKYSAIIKFTVIYVLLISCELLIFHSNGRLFIWEPDGALQHYPAFNYVCDAIMGGFSEGLSSLNPYVFDFTIGQGGDRLTILNSYDLLDPISWVCSLLICFNRTIRYTIMIFVKLWLVGVSFIVYCQTVDKDYKELSIVSGAICYTFSGAILFVSARHPNYVNWAYFGPFILAGYELFKHNRKRSLLVISVALNAMTNYYTLYINALLLAVYIAIDVLVDIKDWGISRERVVVAIESIGLCFIGAALAAFSIVPTIYAYLSNPRVAVATGYTDSLFHYEWSYYRRLLVSIFAPYSNGKYTSYIGLLPIVILSISVLLVKRVGSRRRKISMGMLIMLILMCLPIWGRLTNGLGYATNRWVYAISFLTSFILVDTFEDICLINDKKRLQLIIISVAYVVVTALLSYTYDSILISTSIIMLCFCIAIAYSVRFIKSQRARECIIAASVVICALFEVVFTFEKGYGYYAGVFSSYKEFEMIQNSSKNALANNEDDDFYRVESYEKNNINWDVTTNTKGTSVYWSLLPKSMSEYLYGFEINSVENQCWFLGLDNRETLMELASVKYYTMPTGAKAQVPAYYSKNEKLSDDSFTVYENELHLPIGYTLDKYMSNEEYRGLNPIQKQEAIMQAAIVSGRAIENIGQDICKLKFNSQVESIPCSIAETEGVNLNSGSIEVTGGSRRIILRAEVPNSREVYLRLSGTSLKYPDNLNLSAIRINSSNGTKIEKRGKLTNSEYNWPILRDGITFNLGNADAGEMEIELSFLSDGHIEYEAIELLTLPIDTYKSYANKLQKCAMKNIVSDTNYISGTIESSAERILQMSIPYSKGWEAYIDGVKTKTFVSSIMYTGLIIEPGKHSIVMEYHTPYAKTGIAVSLLSLLICICDFYRRRRNIY